MNVNEGKMYIGVYRYPSSYPMSSTLLHMVMTFFRYYEICIGDRHLQKWRTRNMENLKNGLFEILVP